MLSSVVDMFRGPKPPGGAPPASRAGALRQPAAPVSGIGGNPEGAAALQQMWAEGSGAPLSEIEKKPEEKAKEADKRSEQGANEAAKLPEGERDQQQAALDLERRAHDATNPLSDAELDKLEEQADPQHMRPQDVLQMRGISPEAIETIRNSGNLDTQATVKLGDPDFTEIWNKDGSKRAATQADVDASHTNTRSGGAALPAMTEQQKGDTVAAQAALSEDMQVGAEIRKAIPMGGVAGMIAGVRPGNPSLFGDFGLKRNTEGQTSREAVATLGLDYANAPYVKEGADGKYDFADSVKNEGVMMIDSVMTQGMLDKAQVPLGHDVMATAQAQAADLAARKAAGEDVHIPPLLQTDAGGKLVHAFERNRTGVEDPRTGAGNSTLAHSELMAAAEADRPGEQVNVVNQEMKIGGAAGGAVPLPAEQGGKSQTQMNLVQPDGSVVTVANLVTVTDAEGKPVMVDDGTGKMIPKTRWALNIAPPDEGGMPPELKETWMKRVYDAHTANVAAVAAKNAEIQARNAAKPPGESPDPLRPMPDAIPELDGYRPPEARGGGAV